MQLRGTALSGLNKALGSIPSTTKREKRKSITRKAAILLAVDVGAGLGKINRDPTQSSLVILKMPS